ncbi:MAG TPA: P1 family peptidase [Acidimicrobiia bacterium]|nr:P1 family peptidase [Acidimicrobiia bacterium]
MTLTSIPGIEVGHWTDAEHRTGCTVVVLPEPNITTVEVRGGAPGTRETDLLAVGMRVEQVQAILLTGGSAFGLAAADGVVRELLADGRGHPTPAGPVPIVPGAVVFDLAPTGGGRRPGPEEGAAAYRAASGGPVEMGLVGAGTGTSCAKWRGFEYLVKSGIGSAVVDTPDGHQVAALVVLNPVGDVFTLEGESLTGGSPVPPASGLPLPAASSTMTNTTLVVVATTAAMSRAELTRLAIRAHDALGACLRPAHTRFDGDVVFVSAVGADRGDVDLAAEGAFAATGRAIEAGLRASM